MKTKRSIKRILSLLIVLALAAALFPCSFAEDAENEVTLKDPTEVLTYGLREGNGPLFITKGVLHRGEREEVAYLIALSGAGYNILAKNDFVNFFLSACSLPTDYLATVKKAAIKYIPAGSNVILAGHSLGGTTAQQFAGDRAMRERYNIINVLTCGSPEIVLLKREGSLHRLADVLDFVPVISLAGPVNLFLDISYELSSVILQAKLPHEYSYYEDDCWRRYDCLGVKGGNAFFTCSPEDCVSLSLSRI